MLLQALDLYRPDVLRRTTPVKATTEDMDFGHTINPWLDLGSQE